MRYGILEVHRPGHKLLGNEDRHISKSIEDGTKWLFIYLTVDSVKEELAVDRARIPIKNRSFIFY
jgi:hypothetical protein